jgi:hypothetical protein
MENLTDDKILEKAGSGISQDSETALDMLCLLLATPKKFKDRFEWSFVLGRLFVLMQEQICLKNSSALHYDEAAELITDAAIQDLLSKYDAREKANIYGFLKGASTPLRLDTIEAIAGRI